jgi:hypothetical protein
MNDIQKDLNTTLSLAVTDTAKDPKNPTVTVTATTKVAPVSWFKRFIGIRNK